MGFQLVKVFDRKPNILGWPIDDNEAELTFRLFDHPTVWIFQAHPPLDFIYSHPPQFQTGTNWDNKVRLIGYSIDSAPLKPEQNIQLALFWEALADMDRDYTIFVHLQNDVGIMAAQNDHQVANGIIPTSCWHKGQAIVDKTTLSISPGTPSGLYRLKLGLYSAETLERLPVINDLSGENAVILTDLQILNPG